MEKEKETELTEKETKAETAETVVKKKKKTILFVAAGIVLVAAVIGLIVFVSVSSREKKLREHLDLGDRYFAELEYDKAIAEYKNALDIDPDCKEAYEGIVNCYLAMAAAQDDAAAIRTLEKGSEELKALGAGSEYLVRITERLQFLQAKVLEEPEPDPEPTPEPTPTPEPEPICRAKEVDLSVYDGYGYAYGGVIPILMNDKWGAINYEGESIISCLYSDYYITNNGYTLFSADDEKVLYDNTGKELLRTKDNISVSSEGYALGRIDGMKIRLEYYDYHGKMIASVDVDSEDDDPAFQSCVSQPYAFYEGQTMFFGKYGDEVLDRESERQYRPFYYGIMGTDGAVEWLEGNGLDVNDNSKFMTGAEYTKWLEELEAKRRAAAELYAGVGGSAGAGGPDLDLPDGVMNHGYYTTYYPREAFSLRLRDRNGVVAELVYYGMEINGNELKYRTYEQFGEYDYHSAYVGTGNSMDVSIGQYYYDGMFHTHYGSKIMLRSNDKYALIDLAGGNLEYKIFDFLKIDNEKNWVIYQDDKWGYCDHDGNVLALYDGVSYFSNGYAFIVDGDKVQLIDEDLNVQEEVCSGDSLHLDGSGDLIAVWDDDDNITYYVLVYDEH